MHGPMYIKLKVY